MKIAVASIGRFHVLDLARELDALGEEVAFYSYVPKGRAERFGLPPRCHRGLLPLVAPLVAWQRYAARMLPLAQERAMAYALDTAVAALLKPCDVFVCMSGMYLGAARTAKRRFGAQIWLERGSRHILSQKAILEELGARGPSDFMVERELSGYGLADRIVVPSTHVVQSFQDFAPRHANKLFVNPYGVDLAQFPQRAVPLPPGAAPTVIFVGGWTLRKGVDVLTQAIQSMDGVSLLHVGALGDAPFPSDPHFTHVDPVPQWRLAEFYARAHVFALASREEGLALVQPQALASGLRIVCTERTGGADLALSPALKDRIAVVPCNDVTALAAAIGAQLERTASELPAIDRNLLSWNSYGKRYYDALHCSRPYVEKIDLSNAPDPPQINA